MADPLSVSAGAAGLLALSIQATEYLYEYYTAYRDRDKDLAKTTNRLRDLLQILQSIVKILETRKWQPNEGTILENIERSITHCEEVINGLQEEVEKFKKEPIDGLRKTLVAAGRRAAYPFRQSTLQKLAEDVNDFRDNLSTAMQALHLTSIQKIESDIEEIKNIVQKAQAQHLAVSVRQWLKAPDVTIDFNAASSKRHTRTGQWFIQSPAFTTWLEEENSFLWLYGFAGCGKSVLCSTAIQHTYRHTRSQAGTAVAFFFLTFNDESKQDASAILRALLLQLSGDIKSLITDLARLQESYKQGTPPVPILLNYLRQAVERSDHVYLLIDALDESPADTSRGEVLLMIDSIRGWQLPGLHLLVTSRDMPDIREGLNVAKYSAVLLQNSGIDQDVRAYVSYKVEHDPRLRRWESYWDIIKDSLSSRAKGVFRWVECQLQPLRQCPGSKYDLLECLKQLPKSLDETYERMLLGIADTCQERALRILVLLCLSTRPMTVPEVIDAIAVDIDQAEVFDPERKLDNADDLLRICPGLIEIIPQLLEDTGDGTGDSVVEVPKEVELRLLRIAHFSVQEYLLSSRIRKGRAASFAISQSTGHFQISKTCLIYLCDQNFLALALTRSLPDEYPLTLFAARWWHHHYRLIDIDGAKELDARVLAFFRQSSALERWIRLLHGDGRSDGLHSVAHSPFEDLLFGAFRSDFSKARINDLAVCYASYLGLDRILAALLCTSVAATLTPEEIVGRALRAASGGGHEKVVRYLIAKGADANAYQKYGYTALAEAAIEGHENVVQILLDNGADVNVVGGRYGSVLRAAIERGHEKMVQLLVDNGANVNVVVTGSISPLQAASWLGYEKIVQFLLRKGADINAGTTYHNVLTAAVFRRHEKTMQILIDNGANIHAQGGVDGNALQVASAHGSKEMVQLLLEHGADVNAEGGYYGCALRAASYHGRESVVQILIDHGADVNTAYAGWYEDGTLDKLWHGSAIQVASERGYEKVVSLLLKHGARDT